MNVIILLITLGKSSCHQISHYGAVGFYTTDDRFTGLMQRKNRGILKLVRRIVSSFLVPDENDEVRIMDGDQTKWKKRVKEIPIDKT